MAIKIQGNTIIDDGRNIVDAGISTISGVTINSGIVTASSPSGIVTYYGDGQYLINVISGIGVSNSGTPVGSGITSINFTGDGITSISYDSVTKTSTVNISGVQGTQGVQGLQGTQGLQGLQGTPGQFAGQGVQGVQGLQGVQGTQGLQGLPGQFAGQGVQGLQGLQGDLGSQGIQGLQGSLGFQGLQGLQGDQGNFGDPGPQGPQGLQGNLGTQGLQGISGAYVGQGVQGLQGPLGPTASIPDQSVILDNISAQFNGSATQFIISSGGTNFINSEIDGAARLLISVGGVVQQPDPTQSAGFYISGGTDRITDPIKINFVEAPRTGMAFFGVAIKSTNSLNVAYAPAGEPITYAIIFGV